MNVSATLALAAPSLGAAAQAQAAAPQPALPAPLLLPLDSRPATRVLPALIADLRGGEAAVVPAALLGNATRGADPAALAAWLAAQPTDRPLVAALDALAYGGLVQSRTSPLSAEQALARLVPPSASGRRAPASRSTPS